MNFLRVVPLLSGLPQNILSKLGDVIEQEVFKAGEYIIREGTSGDTFYIIAEGNVRVTKRVNGVEEMIRDLSKGDYFGEQVFSLLSKNIYSINNLFQALLRTDLRTANVIALSEFVECLTLDREYTVYNN